MAEFKRSYTENEETEGEFSMTEGTGLGTGFVGGLIVGGLAGWAFSRDRGNYGYGYPYGAPPVVVNGNCNGVNTADYYTLADVSNLVATKDAQYAQLNATQASEFNVLNTMSRDNLDLTKGLCQLGYDAAMLSNSTQRQIADASAKADLCCCQTQGLINQSTAQTQGLVNQVTAQTQGMVAQIVPQMQNFYLADEVEKLRIKSIKTENAYQFGALTTQLAAVGNVVNAVYDKVNTTTTTTSS